MFKQFFKKYSKEISIIFGFIAFFSLGFCEGRYRRNRILESDSSRIEQRTDSIGSAAVSAGIAIDNAGNNLGSAINFNSIAIGYVDAATIHTIELQQQIDEVIRSTKDYQTALRMAESSIGNLLDLSIRKAELDEQFIDQIIGMFNIDKESTFEQ